VSATTQTDDGQSDLLDCPRCGDPCAEMPPYPPRHPGHHPTWQEGDTGTCACGAPLEVCVDDGRAELRDTEEEDA
jgi:hypothetical protein